MDKNGETVIEDTWFDLLRDLDAECVLQATRQLASQPGQWPPTAGDVRSLAIDLSMGVYAPVSQYEAWEHAQTLSRGETVYLSDIERRVLNSIGGTSTIRSAENIQWVRKAFMEHYTELVARAKRVKAVLPEVAAVADRHAPALPPPAPKVRDMNNESPIRRPSREELREMLKGYRGYQGELNGNENT